MSKKIAVFPGSFDPLTIGHESIIRRTLPLFDELVVAIGTNSTKNYFFSLEKRKEWLTRTFSAESKIRIETYSGLTIDYCKQVKANYILRGLRTSADFEFESNIARMNKAMAGEIETVFIVSLPEYSAISSTIIRDIVRNKGNASAFVPVGIDLK